VHERFSQSRIGALISNSLLLAAIFLAVPPQRFLGAITPKKTVSIAVGYEGSWKLRYKLYYHEIADSEAHELYGIGKQVVRVSPDRELVNLCAWLTSTGAREERERLSLSIVVDDGAARLERHAPYSPFSTMSSICYHF
jgi:hypothetical protein